MLTSATVAERLGAAHSSVNQWAREGRFKGAKQIETPGGHYWLIPESALEGFTLRGRGRPPKPKPATEGTPPGKRG
ncbi:MAG TPA: helix-turn-helix domain-containing protein [Blastocatellia bacterium]|nr:helix-turn-helix domain-containing protein [Blastocatellia bacterium]